MNRCLLLLTLLACGTPDTPPVLVESPLVDAPTYTAGARETFDTYDAILGYIATANELSRDTQGGDPSNWVQITQWAAHEGQTEPTVRLIWSWNGSDPDGPPDWFTAAIKAPGSAETLHMFIQFPPGNESWETNMERIDFFSIDGWDGPATSWVFGVTFPIWIPRPPREPCSGALCAIGKFLSGVWEFITGTTDAVVRQVIASTPGLYQGVRALYPNEELPASWQDCIDGWKECRNYASAQLDLLRGIPSTLSDSFRACFDSFAPGSEAEERGYAAASCTTDVVTAVITGGSAKAALSHVLEAGGTKAAIAIARHRGVLPNRLKAERLVNEVEICGAAAPATCRRFIGQVELPRTVSTIGPHSLIEGGDGRVFGTGKNLEERVAAISASRVHDADVHLFEDVNAQGLDGIMLSAHHKTLLSLKRLTGSYDTIRSQILHNIDQIQARGINPSRPPNDLPLDPGRDRVVLHILYEGELDSFTFHELLRGDAELHARMNAMFDMVTVQFPDWTETAGYHPGGW